MKQPYLRASFVVLLVCVLQACATVSKDTARLSGEIGDRIKEMENLHYTAVSRYFESERRKIDDFMTEKWEPLFLENMLAISGLLKDLDDPSVVNEDLKEKITVTVTAYLDDPEEAPQLTSEILTVIGTSWESQASALGPVLMRYVEDDQVEAALVSVLALIGKVGRGQLILEFVEAAHLEMNAQRQELLAPLEKAERETIKELQDAYAQLGAAQGVLTGRLIAAAKMKDAQDQLFEDLGMGGVVSDINTRLAQVSEATDKALRKADEISEKLKTSGVPEGTAVGDALKEISEILESSLKDESESDEKEPETSDSTEK